MSFCSSNKTFVLIYLNTSTLANFVLLSKKVFDSIVRILRLRKLRVSQMSQKLNLLATKNNLTILHKDTNEVFLKTPNSSNFEPYSVWQSSNFTQLVTSQGIKTNDGMLLKNLDEVSCQMLAEVKGKLHLENVNCVVMSDFWPSNVTIDKVNKVVFKSLPATALPLTDKKQISELAVEINGSCDLSFTEQYTKLLKLTFESFTNILDCSQRKLSHSKLESLRLFKVKVLLDSSTLRELTLEHLDVDNDLIALVESQTRLLRISFNYAKNAGSVNIPNTVRSVVFNRDMFEYNSISSDQLQQNLSHLKLTSFQTNVAMQNIDKINSDSLKYWEVNGLEKRKENNVSVLTITDDFSLKLPYFNRQSDHCYFCATRFLALSLVDKQTTSLEISRSLTGATENLPVLDKVKELRMKYVVSKEEAKVLAKVFPQFSENQLKEKGIQEESCSVF